LAIISCVTGGLAAGIGRGTGVLRVTVVGAGTLRLAVLLEFEYFALNGFFGTTISFIFKWS